LIYATVESVARNFVHAWSAGFRDLRRKHAAKLVRCHILAHKGQRPGVYSGAPGTSYVTKVMPGLMRSHDTSLFKLVARLPLNKSG
jgi:hypothetical protein